jgi:hypothetical protein
MSKADSSSGEERDFEVTVVGDLEEGAQVLDTNSAFVTDILARDKEEEISGSLSLIHFEESKERVSKKPVTGRISGVNRVMLNRLYAAVGANLAESTVTFVTTDTGVDEIIEIPAGENTFFREVTHGKMVNGKFVSEDSTVRIDKNFSPLSEPDFSQGVGHNFEAAVVDDLKEDAQVLDTNSAFVTDILARDKEEEVSGSLSLIHFEESKERVSKKPIDGRISGVNRAMLNRLYAAVGANLAESTVTFATTDTGVDEIIEIPAGENTFFREITHSQMVHGELDYENSTVAIEKNVSSSQ